MFFDKFIKRNSNEINRNKSTKKTVPVYTVEYIPNRNFELMGSLYIKEFVSGNFSFDSNYLKIFNAIGEAGAASGADAVIGVKLMPYISIKGGESFNVIIYGTAIKFTDKDVHDNGSDLYKE